MKNRIFIGGYMHSGTSLLQKILGNHPDIFTPQGEIKFFEFLPSIKKKFPLNNDLDKRTFAGFCKYLISNGVPYTKLKKNISNDFAAPVNLPLISTLNTHTKIFSSVLDSVSEFENKSNWLEKSPNNIFYYDEIIEEINLTKILLIIRDPRDVLSSKKTRKKDISKKFDPSNHKLKKLEKKYSPLIDSYSWASSARMFIGLQEKYPDNCFIFKYEDLISHPEQMVRSICIFLNLEYSDNLLDISFSNSAHDFHQSSGIYLNSEKYKKILNPSEIKFIEWNLEPLLNKFEYKFHSTDGFFVLLSSFRYYLAGVYDGIDRIFSRFRLFGPLYFVSFSLLTIRKIKGVLK